MFWGRWPSLGLGALTTVGGFLLGIVLRPDAIMMEEYLALRGLALVLGGGVGLVHGLFAHRQEAALGELIRQLNGVDKQATIPEFPRSTAGLNELIQAINQVLGHLRRRLETLLMQKRELEIQLRISDAERQHVHTVLNTIADAVLVTDPFNELALANEAAARVLGFDLDQAMHQPVDQVVQDGLLGKLIKDTREGGDTALRRHVEHRLPGEGKESVFDVTLKCVAGSSRRRTDEPCGVVTILRDVTHERQVAEMKSDFVSSVSHELRTPLSSIKAYLEMLIDGEARDDATRLEFYNIIAAEATRLSRLIDNILNISRIESGVVKVQREQVNLSAVIKEALDIIAPQARAKQVKLEEVTAPLYFQVFADRDMILQVMLNLLSNAVKYTPVAGKVTVSVYVDELNRQVHVSIADTGVGIPPEAIPHLFEKFYRVAEHKRMANGTGLGLNLVKQIVETMHGGKVSVTSQPGQGSTFTFCLPMTDNG